MAKKYEVSVNCVCVEIDEDGNKNEILRNGPTWTVPYSGMVAIQQLLIGVIVKIGSWGLAKLDTEEAAQVSGMTKS